MSLPCQFRPTLLHPSAARYGATSSYMSAAAAKSSWRCHIWFVKDQTRARRLRFSTTLAASTSGNEGSPPPSPTLPSPHSAATQGFPTRRGLLAGLGSSAAAVGFAAVAGEINKESEDTVSKILSMQAPPGFPDRSKFVITIFPVDPAEVYKNNRLNKDRIWPDKSEPDPQHRVTIFGFDSKPYLHLDNGGYLRQIPAPLDLDSYGVFSKDSIFLMARGGQVYLLEPHENDDNSPSKLPSFEPKDIADYYSKVLASVDDVDGKLSQVNCTLNFNLGLGGGALP